MNKSEKCYYAIIENKKRGKFSGASPIQVAKKVASKKLKSGKDIEFYLDEVCGKKKRYGPYLGRKNKKTGQVVVVNGGKVMKGGVLSDNNVDQLQRIFLSQKVIGSQQFLNETLPFIPFGREPILYLLPNGNNYSFAVFKLPRFSLFKKKQSDSDSKMDIYIIVKNQFNIIIVNFYDFFFNNEYLKDLKDLKNIQSIEIKRDYLIKLLKLIIENAQSKIITDEAIKISKFLNGPREGVMIYVPDYTNPLQLKCVYKYKNLTCGIVDYTPQKPTHTIEAVYKDQLFLVRYSESDKVNPIIYVRVLEDKNFVHYQFKYCINTRTKTIDILYGRTFKIDDCNILNLIPVEFGFSGINLRNVLETYTITIS